jgi:hypothetical protein
VKQSIYKAIYPFKDIGGDMVQRLKDISVFHLFEPMNRCVADGEDFNKVLFYILEVYSVDSTCMIIGADWQDFKMSRFEENKIDPEKTLDIVMLNSNLIKQTIRLYVDYQKSTNWRHLCMLQDLYTQFLNMAVSIYQIGSTENLMTVDEKKKCAQYAKELLIDIEEFKNKIILEMSPISTGEKELPKSERKVPMSLNVEDYVGKVHSDHI